MSLLNTIILFVLSGVAIAICNEVFKPLIKILGKTIRENKYKAAVLGGIATIITLLINGTA